MLSRPIPPWILIGAFVLTGTAGCVNAVSFLGMHHQAISHMSGTVTVLGNELATGRWTSVAHAAGVVASFFAGGVVSAMIIRQSALKLGRRYGVVLAIESALLFAAYRLLKAGKLEGECLAAAACGLQNAMASHYSGAVIRSTHVTGLITDLSIAVGLRLRGEAVDGRRARLYALLLAGFFAGGVSGSFGYVRLGLEVLLIPAALTGVAGVGYVVFRHLAR